MTTNSEELQGVVSESWQNHTLGLHEIKIELRDEEDKNVSFETSNTSLLPIMSTASTETNATSSMKINSLQPHLVESTAKWPVDIKAEMNVDADLLTEYSADSDQYLIEEFKKEGDFSLNVYIKSEHIDSLNEDSEQLNHLQNSKFTEDIIKEESFAETKFFMPEEVYIKNEDEESDQSNTKPTKVDAEKWDRTRNKNGSQGGFNRTDVPKEEVELHKCPECSFTSKWKKAVTRHLLVHKNSDEITWYKCPECPFKTKRKEVLTDSHMLKHNSKDVPMHKCTLCSFETHRKDNLRQHLKNVHRPKDMELIACPEEGCMFKTHDKNYLKRHVKVSHNSSKIYKCSECFYRTKRAENFRVHKHRHESPDKWLSCPSCPYKTPNRYLLNKHGLIHKSESEIKWFHCSECSYKTKQERYLNQHKLRHNQVFEMFECSECWYKTPLVRNIRQHLWRHKDPNSKTWFQCVHCPYKTTQKCHLEHHSYTHKFSDEIQDWFKCSQCLYKTYSNSLFKKHQLVHMKHEEVTNWYCCYICTWKTSHKMSLARHINRQHRDTEGRICGGLCADDK